MPQLLYMEQNLENLENQKRKSPATQYRFEFQRFSGARNRNQSAMKIRLLCRVFAEFPTLIYHLVEQKASEKTLQNVQHRKDSSSLIFSIDILFQKTIKNYIR